MSRGDGTDYGPRRAAVWLLIGSTLWIAGSLTQRHTRIEVSSDGGRLFFSAADSTVAVPLVIESLNQIEIQAMQSVFPPGGRTIELAQGRQVVFAESLPRRFHIPGGRLMPLGDWELDEWAGSGVVYQRAVAITGPFTLRATLTGRFLQHATVTLHGTPTVSVSFRRGFINNDLFIWSADPHEVIASSSIDPQPLWDVLAIASIICNVVAVGALLIALFTIIGWLFPPNLKTDDASAAAGGRLAVVVAVLLAAATVAISAWVSLDVLEGLPHFPDSVVYLLQAKWILAGRLYQEVAPIQQHLTVPFTYVVDGRWLAHYPVGWPLLLALGAAVGKPWLVAPVLGGAYSLLLYLIGREMYSRSVGVMAVILAVVSPISCLLFASMLSHAASSTLILLFVWLFLVARRRGSHWTAVAAGVSLGFATGIRPLAAIAVGFAFVLFSLFDLSRAQVGAQPVRVLAGAFFGGVIGVFPTLVANHLLTGSPLLFPYTFAKGSMYSLANVAFGLRNMDALLASTLPALYGWGWSYAASWFLTALGLAVAVVPFLLRGHERHDLVLWGCFMAVVVVHLGARAHGLHGFGPRYYFDGLFAIYLLTARGFQELARVGANPYELPVRVSRSSPAFLLATALFVALNASAAAVLPQRLALYRGYNRVDSSLRGAIQVRGIPTALIVFAEPDWRNWAMASPMMEADLCAEFAFAQGREDNSELFDFYSDRPAYSWSAGRLQPIRNPNSDF